MEQARRVTCVITARPSYARIKTALEALRTRVDLSVVCVASALCERYGHVHEQILRDGFSVPWVSYSQIDGDHGSVQARTTGLVLTDLATYFANTVPDAVMVIADRHEVLAPAIAASYQHIPVIHIQGGEVTGSIDDKVRHAVTQLADLHLVSTEDAAARVRAMRPDAEVVVTGCPSLDLAAQTDPAPLTTLPGMGDAIDLMQPFALVLAHPVTDEADAATTQTRTLQRALERVGLPVVWFWPNVDHGAERIAKAMRTWAYHPAHYVRQVPPADFLRLMRQCAVMVGNSSAGIREGSFLGVPVVNIGTRQRGRARGPNVIEASTSDEIVRGIQTWISTTRPQPSTLYGSGTSGSQIASHVSAYVARGKPCSARPVDASTLRRLRPLLPIGMGSSGIASAAIAVR